MAALEVSVAEILRKAATWQEAGTRWHFHLLTPGCMFNERNDLYALVLETPSLQEVYVSYSDELHMEADRILLPLLHGDEIVDEQEAVLDPGTPAIQPILQRARELNARGVAWHHHMLFPGCIFSGRPDRWVIAFEDPETAQVLETFYEREPKGDLRQIELLFAAQQRA
jgi:hypothetical protein